MVPELRKYFIKQKNFPVKNISIFSSDFMKKKMKQNYYLKKLMKKKIDILIELK